MYSDTVPLCDDCWRMLYRCLKKFITGFSFVLIVCSGALTMTTKGYSCLMSFLQISCIVPVCCNVVAVSGKHALYPSLAVHTSIEPLFVLPWLNLLHDITFGISWFLCCLTGCETVRKHCQTFDIVTAYYNLSCMQLMLGCKIISYFINIL